MTSRIHRHDLELARRAHAVLKDALDCEPDARPEFVAQACAGDDALRDEVESLLRAHDEAGDFLESSVDLDTLLASESGPVFQPGEQVGRHRIKAVIGSGGMGSVYLAEQEEPRRLVAVKVMRPGARSAALMRRFRDESQILAQLRHPHVAQVFEAGTYQSGPFALPYYVMEYIEDALSVTEFAQHHGLSLRERLQLFTQICLAVHHGHQKGIVHRDLKPPNVLVDGRGEPKIIDFGIARLHDEERTRVSPETIDGQIVGTLQYMSPEQCAGSAEMLDTRSDVYSLGVILYELLCDQPPYSIADQPIHEAVRTVCETPAIRPSAIKPGLRGDLETIMLKALEKHIDLRYASADALARDIARYLNDEPIEARPASAIYQIRMFTRRNRSMVFVTLSIAALVVLAAIVSMNLAVQARRERQAALWEAYAANITAGNAALRSGETQRLQSRLDRAPEQFRNWEWRYLKRNAQITQATLTQPARVNALAVTRDGNTLVSATRTGVITWWDAETTEVRRQMTNPRGSVYALALHPDDTLVAVGSDAGTVTWFRAGEREPEIVHEDGDWVYEIVFNADGTQMAWATRSGKVHVMDVATREIVHTWNDHEDDVWALAFTPDGQTLVSGSHDNSIRVRDLRRGTVIDTLQTHSDAVFALALSADGRWLASGSRDRSVCVFDMHDLTLVTTRTEHTGPVRSLCFSPDGSMLASASDRRDIRVRRTSDWSEVGTLHGHASAVSQIAFDPSGRWLWSASWDQTIRKWDTTVDWPFTALRGHEDRVNVVAFSPDGESLVSGCRDGSVALWDVTLATRLETIGHHESRVYGVAFARGGTEIVSVAWDSVRVWDRASASARLVIDDLPDQGWCVAVHPDGTSFAVGYNDGTVQVRDLETGALQQSYTDHDSRVLALAFSPDGRRLLTGATDQRIFVYDDGAPSPSHTLDAHQHDVFALAFTADGHTFASGSRDLSIRLWDATTLQVKRTIDGHGQFVTSLEFSPDGSRLVSSSWYGSAQVWDVETGEELLILSANEATVRDVVMSPDGTRIAAACWDGLVRIWDSVPIRQREDERMRKMSENAN